MIYPASLELSVAVLIGLIVLHQALCREIGRKEHWVWRERPLHQLVTEWTVTLSVTWASTPSASHLADTDLYSRHGCISDHVTSTTSSCIGTSNSSSSSSSLLLGSYTQTLLTISDQRQLNTSISCERLVMTVLHPQQLLNRIISNDCQQFLNSPTIPPNQCISYRWMHDCHKRCKNKYICWPWWTAQRCITQNQLFG